MEKYQMNVIDRWNTVLVSTSHDDKAAAIESLLDTMSSMTGETAHEIENNEGLGTITVINTDDQYGRLQYAYTGESGMVAIGYDCYQLAVVEDKSASGNAFLARCALKIERARNIAAKQFIRQRAGAAQSFSEFYDSHVRHGIGESSPLSSLTRNDWQSAWNVEWGVE